MGGRVRVRGSRDSSVDALGGEGWGHSRAGVTLGWGHSRVGVTLGLGSGGVGLALGGVGIGSEVVGLGSEVVGLGLGLGFARAFGGTKVS